MLLLILVILADKAIVALLWKLPLVVVGIDGR